MAGFPALHDAGRTEIDILGVVLAGVDALPARLLMDTRFGIPRSAHGSEYEPTDFCAGLRHCPLVSKQRFSFAGRWFKECCDDHKSKRSTTRSNLED